MVPQKSVRKVFSTGRNQTARQNACRQISSKLENQKILSVERRTTSRIACARVSVLAMTKTRNRDCLKRFSKSPDAAYRRYFSTLSFQTADPSFPKSTSTKAAITPWEVEISKYPSGMSDGATASEKLSQRRNFTSGKRMD